MRRGEIYNARLEPTEGSEQAGSRPVIIVSRESLNTSVRVVLAVPCMTYRAGRHIYVTQALIRAPDGGLDVDSVALCEQLRALDRRRFGRLRGRLSAESLTRLDRALLIALDLPGQW